MARRLILSGLLLLSIAACGYYEGILQPTPKSYLSFTGNTAGALVVIDQRIKLDLDQEFAKTGEREKPVLFQIAPGRHNVVVTRMGAETVNRLVLIADGATMEIQIP